MNALIQGLGLPGTVMDDLIRHRPSGTGYIGVEFGSYHGYWAINGDVASALHLGSDIITFVSGVNLGTDIALPASGKPKLTLQELDEIRLHAGVLAALISGLPLGDDREIRIRFGIPYQQRWLQMLDGAEPDFVLRKETLARLEHIAETRLLGEEYFREILLEMLGGRYEHVSVSTHDELRLAGRHLLTALGSNQVPTLTELADVLRHSPNRAWAYALGPELRGRTGLPGQIDTVGELIELVHAVTMVWAAQDGLAIAVGTFDTTGATLGLAQDLARIIAVSTGDRRYGMLQVNPLPRIFTETGDVPTSAAVTPGSPDHEAGG
jgi:hypothetical protein